MARSLHIPLDDGIPLEGLLCPICYLDLKTIRLLQEHVHLSHSEDEHDLLQTLKGFFGKAKRKIMKQNDVEDYYKETFEEPGKTYDNTFQLSDYLSLNQELGHIITHTPDFKKLRDVRINRYVVETNKLLIRLDKLITETSDDPEKRRAHEKDIVPWIPDNDVRLCPGCAKSFGLPRRRHHCRLCGGVMCKSCSKFIDMSFANNLLQPLSPDGQSMSRSVPSTPVQKRESNASLLSVMNLIGEWHVRTCIDCHGLLVKRKQQLEKFAQRSILIQKYEKMQSYIREIEKLVPLYHRISETLCTGGGDYSLSDAQDVKVKLSKFAEGVDVLSKVITKIPPEEEGNVNILQVQKKIRLFVTQYLRDTVIGLPQLPTEAEIAQYKKLREEQVVKKAPPDEENPMLIQMNIIKQYIKQAREDHKYDEMQMLEKHLEELRAAYMQECSLKSDT